MLTSVWAFSVASAWSDCRFRDTAVTNVKRNNSWQKSTLESLRSFWSLGWRVFLAAFKFRNKNHPIARKSSWASFKDAANSNPIPAADMFLRPSTATHAKKTYLNPQLVSYFEGRVDRLRDMTTALRYFRWNWIGLVDLEIMEFVFVLEKTRPESVF